MDEHVDRTETRPARLPLSREMPTVPASRRGYWILTALTAGLAGGGWYLWSHPQGAQAPKTVAAGRNPQGQPQPVGFATIDRGNIRIILNELGTVASLDTVTVVTQINGQLQEIGFKEGQIVKKGDFLAQVDPRPYIAALEQAQGTLARDQGLLAQAQTNLKRFQLLGRQDSIAQQQVDDQRFLVAQYNYIQTSSTTGLVVITQMQPISVVFAVPEDNLPDIVPRVRSGATLTVEAYDRANVRPLATGRLATLDNQIDTTTGTVKLRAIFDNPDELLYPNQFVNARLLVNTLENTIRVPVQAVQRGEPGTFVYLINLDNTVSVRLVKVGAVDGGFQAVLSGLNPGDKVVTDGTDRLRDGAPISTPTARTGSPAAVGAAAPEPAGIRSPTTGVQPAVRPDTKRPPTAQ